MTTQVFDHDITALALLVGLGVDVGLGIPGPYGNVPAEAVPAGTYEISGTGVAFRSGPSLASSSIGTFNADTSRGDYVVGAPEQVAFNGQVGNADGLSWANVQAQGKTGWVAMKYMAPVGWTAGKGMVATGGGGGGIERTSTTTTTDTTTAMTTTSSAISKYTVPILVGAGALGLGIIGWAVLAKPKGGRRKGHRRAA